MTCSSRSSLILACGVISAALCIFSAVPYARAANTVGAVNRSYTFTAETTDNESDPLFYTFSWGDGTQDRVPPDPNTVPSDPIDPSIARVSASHSWNAVGVYSVYVIACDPVCSPQSDTETMDIQLPSKPGPITLASGSDPSPTGTFTLTWTDSIPHSLSSVPVFISQYYIYRQSGGDPNPFNLINTVTPNPPNPTTYQENSIPDGDYAYFVIAEDDTTPTPNLSPASDIFTITVNSALGGSPPTADFDWCAFSADTTQFGDLSSDDGALAWSWDFGDGSALATDQHPVHTFLTGSDTLEVDDQFSVSSDTPLANHTPSLPISGGGYTQIINNGTCTLYIESSSKDVNASTSINSGGCGSSEGQLYQTDTSLSSADYDVSVKMTNGDNGDDYNFIAARIQDANNMYVLRFNSTNEVRNSRAPGIYKLSGGVWGNSPLVAITNTSISNNSIVTLRVKGDTLKVFDGTVEIASYTDPSPLAGAGYAGIGMGAVLRSSSGSLITDDVSAQRLDNFQVTTLGTSAPYTVALTVTDIGLQSDTAYDSVDPSAPGMMCTDLFKLTSAVATKCTEVGLVWSAAVAANNYTLWRADYNIANCNTGNTSGCTWIPVQANLTTLFTYDTTAAQESAYLYYVRANLGSATTLNNSTLAPACAGSWSGSGGAAVICPLTAFTGSCVPSITPLPATSGCGAIPLSWSSVSGATAYRVWRNIGSDNFAAAIEITPPGGISQLSYTDTDIIPDVIYYYYVTDQDGATPSGGAYSLSSCFRGSRWQER